MMHIPSPVEIEVVEQRLWQCRRDIRSGIDRTRLAVRGAVKQQSPLAMVVVAAGISAIFFTRRKGSNSGSAPRAAPPGVVRTFIAGSATQLLGIGLQQMLATRLKRRTDVQSGMAEYS